MKSILVVFCSINSSELTTKTTVNNETTSASLALDLLSALSKLSAANLMPLRKPRPLPTKTGTIATMDLENPFAVQVCRDTFDIIMKMLCYIVPVGMYEEESDSGAMKMELNEHQIAMIDALLQVS